MSQAEAHGFRLRLSEGTVNGQTIGKIIPPSPFQTPPSGCFGMTGVK